MTAPAKQDEKPTENPTTEDNDDDEDDDEDYNPDKDKDADAEDDDPMEGGDESMMIVEETSVLAPSQQKAVDEAFQELFGYKWGTSFELPRRQRRQNRADATANLLVQVLGPIRAARVLQSGGAIRPRRQRQVQAALSKWNRADATTETSTSPQPAGSQKQYETKLFAGQKIQVAVTGNKKANSKTATATPSGGIDSVLQQIAGPSKISTVAKTSADWDTFKTETGLEAELEKKAQGKDAFLVKQDFLTRVDNRKFELERDDRDRERAKRGK